MLETGGGQSISKTTNCAGQNKSLLFACCTTLQRSVIPYYYLILYGLLVKNKTNEIF